MDMRPGKMEAQQWMRYEWWVLSGVYMTGMVMYTVKELLSLGRIDNGLSISLLALADYFLLAQFKRIYRLITEEDSCYVSRPPLERDVWIKALFLRKGYYAFGLLYAVVFSYMISREAELGVKSVFFICVLLANTPIGIGIARLIVLEKHIVRCIQRLDYDVPERSREEERYIKHLQTLLIYTTTVVCMMGQFCMMAFQARKGWVTYLYAVIVLLLVVCVTLITNYAISQKRSAVFKRSADKLNSVIEQEWKLLFDQGPGGNTDKLDYYVHLKEALEKQKIHTFEWDDLMSSAGMMLLSVLPVLLQWLLKHFE